MNIPKYSLENQKIIYFFLAVMLIGGIYSFFKLPKKEDSPFVIKQAVLVTQYPGATPQEVEKLVTEPIEREIQAMSDVFQIKSESYFGMSKISIELQPTLSPDYMPVKWDELRRKVANIQPRLPSGASSISVSDDFGDVFGIYYALTADEGYTYDDLRNWAQKIKTELSPVPGVQKVYLFGEQTQVVNVKISIPKLANLGIDPNAIQQVMQTQNLLVNTGDINTGNYQLRLRAEGTYKDIQDIRDQLIVTKSGGKVVAATQVEETDQIMLITDAGTLVRTRVSEVSIVGRNTQGVRLIRTAEDEHVVSLERICDVDDEDEGTEDITSEE